MNPIFNTTDQHTFNGAYSASVAPVYRPLLDPSLDPTLRANLLQQMLEAGLPVDTQIMAWAWDAYGTMLMRVIDGYTWVPSMGQPNIPVAPNIVFPGLPSYDPANPPKGSIRVSLAVTDYPQWTDPNAAPVVLPAAVSPVGMLEIGGGGVGSYYAAPNVNDGHLIGSFYPADPAARPRYQKVAFGSAWSAAGMGGGHVAEMWLQVD